MFQFFNKDGTMYTNTLVVFVWEFMDASNMIGLDYYREGSITKSWEYDSDFDKEKYKDYIIVDKRVL